MKSFFKFSGAFLLGILSFYGAAYLEVVSFLPNLKKKVVQREVHVLTLSKEELGFMRQPHLRPASEGMPTCVVLGRYGDYEVSGSSQRKDGLHFSFSLLGDTGRYFNEILGRFTLSRGRVVFKSDKGGKLYRMPGWTKGPGGRVLCRQFKRSHQWWKKTAGKASPSQKNWWKSVK